MSSTEFESTEARSCADGIAHVAEELQGIADALAQVNVSSFVNGQIAADYQASITEVATVTSGYQQEIATYARALTTVADAFDATEARAQSSAGDASAAPATGPVFRKATDADGSASTSIIDRIKSFFNIPEPTEEEKQRKREKTHDLAMQDEVFDLLKDDSRFTKKTWKKATTDERKQMVRELMPEIARIYGITTPAALNFFQSNDGTMGYFSSGSNSININENMLGEDDYRDLTHTMIHEMRHAYQHQVIDNPSQFDVSAETVKQWQDNFAEYASVGDPAPDGHIYTYEEYIQQPIEWDAWNFEKEKISSKYTPDYEGSWKDEPNWHFWNW